MSDVLSEQKRYYAERAPEYDDWWYRRGRYELAPDALARWQADVAEAEARLAELGPRGSVLELAAGTGIWTRQLVRTAERVVAVDANAETLALNTPEAEHVVADVFDWRPEERFDLVFFSFWHSHVPDELLDEFWAFVRSVLTPDGRVFLVDNAAGSGSPHTVLRERGLERRRIADGREFTIVKRYWDPRELAERMRPLGFELDLARTANGYFLVGGSA